MIARDLARYMGDMTWNYEAAADMIEEIAALVPAYAGMSYGSLKGMGYCAVSNQTLRRLNLTPPVKLDGIPQFASDQFPLTLITERNLFHYYGACPADQVPGMNLIKQEETLYLNAADICQLGVSDGDLVTAFSPHGSTECIVREANRLLPGRIAFASFNRMSSSALFPLLTPDAKAYAVRIQAETQPAKG